MAPPDQPPSDRERNSGRRRDPRLDAMSRLNPTVGDQGRAAKPSPGQAGVGKSKPRSPRTEDAAPIDVPESAIVSAVPGAPDSQRSRKRQIYFLSVSGLIVAFSCSAFVWAFFLRGNANRVGPQTVVGPIERNASVSPKSVPVLSAPRRPVKVRIETSEPGFYAFVDEEAVRDSEGQLVLTPCEVIVERGRHTIRVVKKGWNDIPRVVDVESPLELMQEPTYEPFAETSTASTAPYLTAKLGVPVLLQTLSLNGRVQDPFVSANEKEIWYAGSGPEGMGIYYSVRGTPDDEWETPSLLVLSRGADLPASPSATEDSLLVAYTVPGKGGRIWGLSRKSVDESFDSKKPLHYADRGDPEWPSAQISADGMRLFWLEVNAAKRQAWSSSRFEREVEFGKGKKLTLSGGHPHLSFDELRQYDFDGKVLRRATRSKSDGAFSSPEVIHELNLEGYVSHPNRRQFWISEDEQWLYFANDPESSGSLYVVRLTYGAGRGVRTVAKSVKPKVVEIAKTDGADENKTKQPVVPAAKPDEPPTKTAADTAPASYAEFSSRFSAYLSQRDHLGATKLLQLSKATPQLKQDLRLLEWDEQELADIQKFWKSVESAINALKAGDPIRIGGSGFTFTKYENEIFTLATKSKTVERKLRELSSGDLLALADKIIEKGDPSGQLQIASFLYYEGKGQAQATKTRLERAGVAGAEFRDRHANRKLAIIERDLTLQNLGSALQRIDELALSFPQSAALKTAEKHRKEIYSFVKWDTRGRRSWKQGEDGLFAADAQKQPDSFLISPVEYEDFDLTLEWQVTGPLSQGGIYFRYPGSGKPLETAFKIHLANDAGVAADKFCTGSLFNIAPPITNAAKPAGQWNTLSMKVRGEQVDVVINGKKVQETSAIDAAVPKRGFVLLDGEFGGISYQKILLIEAGK